MADDPVAIEPGTVVRLVTHDSFSVSDGLFDNFTLDTGIEVEVINGGDAGEVVARAVLSSDQPEGDVLFGIDNTFLQRGLDADLFLAYESPGLGRRARRTGARSASTGSRRSTSATCASTTGPTGCPTPRPISTTSPTRRSPAPSSPPIRRRRRRASPSCWPRSPATARTAGRTTGVSFVDGGVTVTPGWTEAYYGEFVAGGGDKALVTSYASSPVAEVLFATEAIETAPTEVMTDGCFRQIEFAGVLAGTEVESAAGKLIDFMLSETFQADIPLNMFVAPANAEVALPELYRANAAEVTEPLTISPADIEANRSDWTERWAEIVLR